MKKRLILLLVPLVLLSGCGKKKEKENLFESYVLKVKTSDICEFKDLSADTRMTIKSYCLDTVLLTDKNKKTYELKDLLQDEIIDFESVVEGLVIKEEEKDGSIMLYEEEHPEYTIIKCADKYPNRYVIVNFMDYKEMFCEL